MQGLTVLHHLDLLSPKLIPSSLSLGLTCSNISECGVSDAPTFKVISVFSFELLVLLVSSLLLEHPVNTPANRNTLVAIANTFYSLFIPP